MLLSRVFCMSHRLQYPNLGTILERLYGMIVSVPPSNAIFKYAVRIEDTTLVV